MTAHASRFELVHSGPRRFFARYIAGNGEEVWRTSESYRTRRAAMEAVALLVDHCASDPTVGIRAVDERPK